MIYESRLYDITATFNSNDLNSSPYKVLDMDAANTGKLDVNKYKLVNSDGEIITSTSYKNKSIVLEGRIKGTTRSDLDGKIDTFKTYLVGYNKELKLTINGAFRLYTATCTETTYSFKDDCVCLWRAVFDCLPIGLASTSTTLTFGTYTTNSTSYGNTILGSYYAEPIIDGTINTIDNYYSASYIQLYNAARNQTLRITKIWGFFDRFVVDSSAKTVSVYESSNTLVSNCDSVALWDGWDTLSLDTTNNLQGDGCIKIVTGAAVDQTDITYEDFDAIDMSSTAGTMVFSLFVPTPVTGAVDGIGIYTGSNTTISNDHSYWYLTTTADGGSITENAWNTFALDLSDTPDYTDGTPVQTAILSLSIEPSAVTTFELDNLLLDYITIYKANATATTYDYEGTFLELDLGSSPVVVSDEFTDRNITITGSYYKRYL